MNRFKKSLALSILACIASIDCAKASPVKAAALAWVDAGCSVIPIRGDGSKAPNGPWKAAQTVRAARDVVTGWLGQGGIGVVCGAVSGHLEMFELEGRAVTDGYGQKLREAFDSIEDPTWDGSHTEVPLLTGSGRSLPLRKISNESEKLI